MDPFTQRILERAEQRSRTLGVSKPTKFPLSDREQTANVVSSESKQFKITKTTVDSSGAQNGSPTKLVRQFSIDKENMDVGIEINITTGPNVDLQVGVEEREVDADVPIRKVERSEPTAQIRDCSRNRLQRLGALYSDTDSLSSPIHRTEAKFHAEEEEKQKNSESEGGRSRPKLGKLVALADSIKSWEDDTSHPDVHKTPKKIENKATNIENGKSASTKGKSERRQPIQTQAKSQQSKEDIKTKSANDSKTKHLKWDKSVMDSLQAQGFQRRESSASKLHYEYTANRELMPPKMNNETTEKDQRTENVDSKTKSTSIRSGLVSNRAAEYENRVISSPGKQNQKDPAEMSLRERMMVFERNKGKAPIPKAPFAMAVPQAKIHDIKKTSATKSKEYKQSGEQLPKDFPSTDVKIRDKVAALTASSTTISENKIKSELKKQRDEDMEVVLNRFNRPKEINRSDMEEQTIEKPEKVAPPPPPPMPMPRREVQNEHVEAKCMINNKRRSPGHRISDNLKAVSSIDDAKRVRVSPSKKTNRLYPVLSDLESTASENDNVTTATMSAYSSDDQYLKQGQYSFDDENDVDDDDDDDNDGDDYIEDSRRVADYEGNNFNESLMDSDDSIGICNGSLGREIMQVVRTNDNQSAANRNDKARRYGEEAHYGDSSVNSNATSDCSGDVNDYLNDALDVEEEEESDSNNDGYSPRRVRPHRTGTTSSNSFSYQKPQKKQLKWQSISEESESPSTTSASTGDNYRSPVKSSLKVDPTDDNVVTLVHTVSFYRRQQSSNQSTPVRKVYREQQTGSSSGGGSVSETESNEDVYSRSDNCYGTEVDNNSEQNNAYMVQAQIKKLLDEVCKQQQIIAQTSQALNLCAATIEFSGSIESVEGERHLLVATHRRQAALDELQRLKVEKSLRPFGAPKEKGRLTVREITVPLKQDYIRKLAADTISGHHLVCLLKYNENVLATRTVPTLPGLLAVKFPDVLQLNNVYADFKITIEIYGMTAQREVLPHEVKYHLNKKPGGKNSKSKKGTESRLHTPMIQSPAGPNVVRSPGLVQYGFVIFSLREIQRSTWALNQASAVSILEGTVHMKVNCELSVSVEYKGFLTMFEDISGFGAWHRRWCHLNGHVLNYWKYPDDEKKKTPMGSIDLYTCCSTKITTAPRDVCARLNTFLVECERPGRDDDFESLLKIPKGNITIIRYLLSADTKEERDEWCAHFNKALTLLRAWGAPK